MEKTIYNGLDYDDVIAVPVPSTVNHLDDVNLYSDLIGKRTGKKFLPIFSSPMRGISGVELVKACYDNDVLGILHRFDDYEGRLYDIHTLADSGVDFGISIGIKNPKQEIELAIEAHDAGATIICVDIANGYIESLTEFIKELVKIIDIPIMSGNIVNPPGAIGLYQAGAKFVRVGIGSGNLCLTRDYVGVGMPQLSALGSCDRWRETVSPHFDDCFFVSDGGIINPARALKSFVFGADFVMIGSMFGSAIEAENDDNKIYGMASRRNQVDAYGYVRSVEGRELTVDGKRPLKEIVSEFTNGLKSGCAYLDCDDYRKLKDVKYLVTTGKGTLK